jgi:hypothetical protein
MGGLHAFTDASEHSGLRILKVTESQLSSRLQPQAFLRTSAFHFPRTSPSAHVVGIDDHRSGSWTGE